MNMNATLLGQAISFILFVWFCMKFVWPPIMQAIEKRQQQIAEGLSSAEEAKKDLENAQVKKNEIIEQAKKEASSIIEQANKRKQSIVDEAQQDALREKDKILAQGRSEIESERKQAQDQLRKQIGTLAIMGAEKIIQRSIDEAANNDIIDKLVAEL